jgi:hypothetical protein
MVEPDVLFGQPGKKAIENGGEGREFVQTVEKPLPVLSEVAGPNMRAGSTAAPPDPSVG